MKKKMTAIPKECYQKKEIAHFFIVKNGFSLNFFSTRHKVLGHGLWSMLGTSNGTVQHVNGSSQQTLRGPE